MYIILNEQQINLIQNQITTGYMLNPIKLNDGITFVLPIQILSDKNHSVENRILLSTFPIREINDNEWVPPVIEYVEE